MMVRNSVRLAAGVLAVGVLSVALTGCNSAAREAERVAVQEAQLQAYKAQARAWGAEIVAQIPPDEIEDHYAQMGGVRQVSEYYEEWPKYYFWGEGFDLYPDGVRTPTQLADDLDPWLAQQGWERDREHEWLPGREFFRRDYYRGPYHLTVEVYTVLPPQAQSINFRIVTPPTDPDSEKPK